MGKVLFLHSEECIACRACEIVCALSQEGLCNPASSRSGVVKHEEIEVNLPLACASCEDPVCVAICPSGASRLNAIWPEAIEQGRIAALNLLGAEVAYPGGIPRNVINIFEIPFLSIGYLTEDRQARISPVGGRSFIFKGRRAWA